MEHSTPLVLPLFLTHQCPVYQAKAMLRLNRPEDLSHRRFVYSRTCHLVARCVARSSRHRWIQPLIHLFGGMELHFFPGYAFRLSLNP